MTQRILAIDDSPDIHRLLDVRLHPEGAVLYHALDAREGMRMARELQPDLMLLDIDMPELTGFEVCRLLKSDPATDSFPIIFLTGASDTFDKVHGFDCGAIDYVTKPFDATELAARVRAALRTKRYQDLLAARCDIDPLTGLGNRGFFDRRLKEELSAARRYHRKVCLIMLDVDHFKRVNDGQGHPFGDRVIEAIGTLLRTTVRDTDAACRYGGEEFGLILSDTTMAGGVHMAERLRGQVEGLSLRHRGQVVTITASFGVADVETTGDSTPEALIEAADDALYAAKGSGRNCVRAAQGPDEATSALKSNQPVRPSLTASKQ